TNYQGIHKPAYFAYKFFNQLGPIELENSDRSSWVCKDEQGGLQVLCWDFTLVRPGDQVNNQSFFNTDLPSTPAGSVRLYVENLAAGKYRMNAYKVGYRSNDAYTAYLDMGAPQQLTRDQVKTLKLAGSGSPYVQETIHIEDDGVLNTTFPLLKNDVVLIVCERVD
ncbi:MAG: hypothetical protein PHF70_13880, partial [Opitutales bacterium]|nr:hypothetical protein [Opitutales bacterium]